MTDLSRIDSQNIWHPFTPLVGADDPILITEAEGIYLKTADGRKVMDCISSWWVNLHGHSNQEIAMAITDQAQKLEHVIFAGFTHEPAITLSQNLLSILPSNQTKVFFSDDGSTAVEVGLKMALQYWKNLGVKKTKIVAIEGAYHGDTFGAMSVGERGLFTHAFADQMFEVEFIPFPAKGFENITIEAFRKVAETGEVSLFIYEPLVQGASGMRIYSRECLEELLTIATQNNVIKLADEVLTGFGRTGKHFASDYVAPKPDIIAISKGITGGTLPLGVTSCCKDIVQAFESHEIAKTFFHGHSYTANPLTCAAANASFNILLRASTQTQIQKIGESHKSFVTKIMNHAGVSDVRNLGTILAIEIKSEAASSYANEDRKLIYKYFLDRNLLLRPLGNVVYVLPPYVITMEELDHVYDVITEFLDELL